MPNHQRLPQQLFRLGKNFGSSDFGQQTLGRFWGTLVALTKCKGWGWVDNFFVVVFESNIFLWAGVILIVWQGRISKTEEIWKFVQTSAAIHFDKWFLDSARKPQMLLRRPWGPFPRHGPLVHEEKPKVAPQKSRGVPTRNECHTYRRHHIWHQP